MSLFSAVGCAERCSLSGSNPIAARGIADLWVHGQTPETDEWSALAELIGPTRARLLLQLVAPMTTGEVARRVGTTAGAVSQHLTALAGAGMLDRTRVGRRVYHQRSVRAQRVLEAMRPPEASAAQ
jgi:DNA-binding transcriptional ArsR family regulator